MTDSLRIMMTLEGTFTGPNHKRMWPAEGTAENARAQTLMRLERSLFGVWCNLVFRGSMGNDLSNAPSNYTLLNQHTSNAPCISLPFTPSTYVYTYISTIHPLTIHTSYIYYPYYINQGMVLDERSRKRWTKSTENCWSQKDHGFCPM